MFELGPAPAPGHGVAGAYITGEVILPGGNEFFYNDWDVIPKPREGEIRVAYVYTTRPTVTSSAVGAHTSLAGSTWLGWIRVLPSKPISIPCRHSTTKPSGSFTSL